MRQHKIKDDTNRWQRDKQSATTEPAQRRTPAELRGKSVSAKPERMIPPQPPPKPHPKCPPKPPIKPPQLFGAMRAGIEEEKERRKQEDEQWKDLVVKERDESEGQDIGKVNGDPRDTELTTPTVTEMPSLLEETVMKSRVNQEVELPKGGKIFCLKPPCRNRPTAALTAEHRESQHPGKQPQNKANGQVQPGPLPQRGPARVNPLGTDSNTEYNKEIQMSGQGRQDCEVISKFPSGHRAGTEVEGTRQPGLQRLEDAQEIAETLPDGEPKQTNQKTNARGKVKKLAKKVMGRLKEAREEKRKIKVEEMEMGGVREDVTELTQDERSHGEEGGMEEEEEEEGIDEDAGDQSAVTETQSHADLVEGRIKRRNATSESPFSSFKVCSPVKLVEELLSGDEWSQFLYRDQSSTPDPPPYQTRSEDTAQLRGDFHCNSSAELDLALDVFEGNPADPEEEPVYEDIDLSNITQKSQTREQQIYSNIPNILLHSEASQMSPRTKDIYDTVEFIQPVQPANTYFSDIKSERVLDSSVQKYLIKLSKRRRRAARKQRRDGSHESFGHSPSSTSPPQVFPASIFYNIPASGGEEEQQLSTGKSGGSSPRCLAKIKTALKDQTLLRAAQPEEDRGK
ncbi:cilia- and flagella-associated protein 251-like isoform X2 [Siniperca chuatsi]|uniref:cilia- and flagella-associated protein 251-like isoform X2 n=1 Tax=Siniperca chuatsi TaxID=119488 RepID=UPI001CE1B6E5|nr:cilia- and flagella-associated protein 251-like isoform X2 [Siniperca chuatsi]